MNHSARTYDWKRYLRDALLTLVLTVGAVGAVNIFVDPMRIFGSPSIASVNAVKPYLDHHRELVRWVSARRLCPNVGIFGNSRAEIGFDPANPLFERRGLTAFNYVIPGSSVYLAYRQIRWLEGAGCMPRTLILGVEFFDFLGATAARPLPAPETDPPPRIDARFLAETVFSVAGLKDSLNTLALQFASYPATQTDRGFNPLLNYIPEVAQSGHYLLFRQRAEEYVSNWSRKASATSLPSTAPSQDEQLLDAVLTQAGLSGSEVHVVIYPYHAQIRLLLERMGLGEQFSAWKRRVFELSERHSSAGHRVAVWDFSGISPETLEAIPARGDRRTQLRYYWESGHFKKELGDRILARILDGTDGFGTRLSDPDVDKWLMEDRARVRALLATPSPLRSEVDEVLAKWEKR